MGHFCGSLELRPDFKTDLGGDFGLDYGLTGAAVGDYVKGTSISDVSESGVLHTHSPAKNIAGTGSPILEQITLVKPGNKNQFF